MSRLKPKALSNPPSQPPLEGGFDSATTLTPFTVAHPRDEARQVCLLQRAMLALLIQIYEQRAREQRHV